MKFITLSGVDGSGKSTQLKLLKERFGQDGKKVFYFHAIEFSSANKLARILKGEKEFTPGSEKASVKASWFSLQLRKVFLFIDIIRFKSLYTKLERENYEYILSDRYFYDSIINILYLGQQNKKRYEGISSESEGKGAFSRPSLKEESRDVIFLSRFIPRPDFAFYFQIPAEEIMKRDRVPEQGIDYLKDKISIFEQKKGAFGLISIDALRNTSLIHDDIYSNIIKSLSW